MIALGLLFGASTSLASASFMPSYLMLLALQQNIRTLGAPHFIATSSPLVSPIIAPLMTPANPTANTLAQLTAPSTAPTLTAPTVLVTLPSITRSKPNYYTPEQLKAIIAAARKFYPYLVIKVPPTQAATTRKSPVSDQ